MFEWVSFIGNYAVHKKVILSHEIFNKQSQLYSALKMNIISKCSIGFHLEETTRFIIIVLSNRVIFNKQSQLFEKYGSFYFRYFVRYLSIKILVYLFTWPPLGSKNQPQRDQVHRYTSI